MSSKNKSSKNKSNKNKSSKNTIKEEHKSMSNKYKNITATVSIDAIRNNLQLLERNAKTDIMPVLKSNAYGHGMVPMSKICRKLGVKYIGVATLGEAIELRDNGDKGRIIGWLYDVNSPEIKESVKRNIDIGIFDENHIDIISNQIPKNKKLNVHLFVDTGINRNGIPYENAFEAAKKISKNLKFNLVGLMSHLCCSDEKLNNKPTLTALEKFRELRKKLKDIGIIPELVHIGNTDGILNYDLSDFTLARSGSGIYGYCEYYLGCKELIPVMDVKSKIIQVKQIKKGDTVGYNRTFTAHKDMFIAIVPVGYADFIPLTKSETLSVIVNGTERKIIGKESMDQMTIEANEIDKIDDEVLLFGNPKNGYPSLMEIAKKDKTIYHTVLTHIGERVKHIYV